MKGLIIKDIMCLRKQLTLFFFVMFGTVVISIMFVLSAKYGNIAVMGRQMLEINENGMSQIDIINLANTVMMLFMILPIACVGDMVNVFVADGKAGFNKVSCAIPLSVGKRLLARFLTIFALFGLGVAIDTLLAFILSFLTDICSFGEMFGVMITAASVVSIYSAVLIFFCILLGYGREMYAQVFTILTIVGTFVIIRFKSLKEICIRIFINEQGFDSDTFWKPLNFIKEKGYVFFIIACAVCILSYFCSLRIAERKRGVI